MGNLRNMTSIYLRRVDKFLLLYRMGSRVIGDSYTGTAGGHMEESEINNPRACVLRELQEETGAIDFTIEPICIYSVKGKTRVNENVNEETFGMLFAADVFTFEELHSEIEKIIITDTLVENWTYPMIQPKLIAEATNRGFI